jgi:hypothetical protein
LHDAVQVMIDAVNGKAAAPGTAGAGT